MNVPSTWVAIGQLDSSGYNTLYQDGAHHFVDQRLYRREWDSPSVAPTVLPMQLAAVEASQPVPRMPPPNSFERYKSIRNTGRLHYGPSGDYWAPPEGTGARVPLTQFRTRISLSTIPETPPRQFWEPVGPPPEIPEIPEIPDEASWVSSSVSTLAEDEPLGAITGMVEGGADALAGLEAGVDTAIIGGDIIGEGLLSLIGSSAGSVSGIVVGPAGLLIGAGVGLAIQEWDVIEGTISKVFEDTKDAWNELEEADDVGDVIEAAGGYIKDVGSDLWHGVLDVVHDIGEEIKGWFDRRRDLDGPAGSARLIYQFPTTSIPHPLKRKHHLDIVPSGDGRMFVENYARNGTMLWRTYANLSFTQLDPGVWGIKTGNITFTIPGFENEPPTEGHFIAIHPSLHPPEGKGFIFDLIHGVGTKKFLPASETIAY